MLWSLSLAKESVLQLRFWTSSACPNIELVCYKPLLPWPSSHTSLYLSSFCNLSLLLSPPSSPFLSPPSSPFLSPPSSSPSLGSGTRWSRWMVSRCSQWLTCKLSRYSRTQGDTCLWWVDIWNDNLWFLMTEGPCKQVTWDLWLFIPRFHTEGVEWNFPPPPPPPTQNPIWNPNTLYFVRYW